MTTPTMPPQTPPQTMPPQTPPQTMPPQTPTQIPAQQTQQQQQPPQGLDPTVASILNKAVVPPTQAPAQPPMQAPIQPPMQAPIQPPIQGQAPQQPPMQPPQQPPQGSGGARSLFQALTPQQQQPPQQPPQQQQQQPPQEQQQPNLTFTVPDAMPELTDAEKQTYQGSLPVIEKVVSAKLGAIVDQLNSTLPKLTSTSNNNDAELQQRLDMLQQMHVENFVAQVERDNPDLPQLTTRPEWNTFLNESIPGAGMTYRDALDSNFAINPNAVNEVLNTFRSRIGGQSQWGANPTVNQQPMMQNPVPPNQTGINSTNGYNTGINTNGFAPGNIGQMVVPPNTGGATQLDLGQQGTPQLDISTLDQALSDYSKGSISSAQMDQLLNAYVDADAKGAVRY